jgi:hypothetical protein
MKHRQKRARMIAIVRAWLASVIGTGILGYTDDQVLDRYHRLRAFYGGRILRGWNLPPELQ